MTLWREDFFIVYRYLFGLRWRFPPSTLRFFQYYTMILPRPRIMVGDAGFETGSLARYQH